MAYLRTTEILTRLQEIIEDGLAQYRTIAAGTYVGDLPTGLSTVADQRRALEAPRVEVSFTGVSRAAESPPTNGSLLIYDFGIELRIIRLVDRSAQLTPALKLVIEAEAMRDADVCRQAVEYVRNTRFTAAGSPTGIIGIRYISSGRPTTRGLIDDGAQTVETLHTFSGKAVTTPEVDTSLEIENPQDNPDIGISIDTEETP